MNATDRENLKLFRRYNPEVRISNSLNKNSSSKQYLSINESQI
jgi:hypothetical protein